MEFFQGPQIVVGFKNELPGQFEGKIIFDFKPKSEKAKMVFYDVNIDPIIYVLTGGKAGYTYVKRYV